MTNRETISPRLAALGLIRALLTNGVGALAVPLPATDPPTVMALT